MRMLFLAIPFLMMLSCANNSEKNEMKGQSTDSENVPDMHNSKTSLDWAGRYTGVLPCADCDGIETIIYLSEDNSYAKRQTNVGKGADPIEESGEYTWSEDGGSITLGADNQKYKVGENVLIALDQSGKEITGDIAEKYRLSKAFADSKIENITWELTEIDGVKVTDGDTDSKAYFILNSSEGRVSGNLGCNNFFGTYALESGMRISFGQMGVTMIACPGMSAEQRLNEIFGVTDNYTVQNGILSLNKARMAPLAVFKAVDK
ncbi:META domain-containing protein [Cryomorpha ignava]|uniref:META domain-containing protein n=1 Tax=Cryomorpha ignava TaxID=101383 RepID=A0A7K3WSS5_9FLAO|nr:copper resistance protein NlpE N-terminal domain-containing protein [Cryomorpha ignava]NEN24743.1 META domain-containing protein [Cryomorpha ignava]